jgi:hypothetical protein
MTQSQDILRQSGLPAELIAKMQRTVSVISERCDRHPESPTGYVGRGKSCEHRPGHVVVISREPVR